MQVIQHNVNDSVEWNTALNYSYSIIYFFFLHSVSFTYFDNSQSVLTEALAGIVNHPVPLDISDDCVSLIVSVTTRSVITWPAVQRRTVIINKNMFIALIALSNTIICKVVSLKKSRILFNKMLLNICLDTISNIYIQCIFPSLL